MRPAVEQLARLSASAPDNPRIARTLALGYGRLAEVLSNDGRRVDEAWPLLLKERGLLDRLASSAPDSSDLAHLHAFARHDAAVALLQMGHFQEAERSAQQALAEFRSLSASDPKVAEYHMDIALALNDMAKSSLGRDKPDAALTSLQEAIVQTADSAVGKSAQSLIVRADSQSLLGDVDVTLAKNRRRTEAQKSRDREDACHQYEAALMVYRAESQRFATAATKAQQAASKLEACR
jgi:tetratricopeptide (TPR) repeat protein